MRVIKKIETKEDCFDLKGTKIPKGTMLHVTWIGEKAPFGDGHRLMKVRVDNGTGHLDLMPETVVRDTEVQE